MQTSCLASDSTCVAQVLSGFIGMAHSLGSTSKKDDVGKPVVVDVEDAADRGFRKRKFERGRVELRKIGFWPENRGGTGINPRHVHDVAIDIMKRKVRLPRYEPVDLIEIPEPLRKRFRAANKEKCDTDPLMPSFNPEMEYVCVAKTHFTHACKLAMNGSTHLFNKPDQPKVRFQANDAEGEEIKKKACQRLFMRQASGEIWRP